MVPVSVALGLTRDTGGGSSGTETQSDGGGKIRKVEG